jgi:hypothetical protein
MRLRLPVRMKQSGRLSHRLFRLYLLMLSSPLFLRITLALRGRQGRQVRRVLRVRQVRQDQQVRRVRLGTRVLPDRQVA